MAKEELIVQLGMIEQEMNQLGQKNQIAEQQIEELQSLKNSLEGLGKTEEKSMLANLGKGIFIRTEIQDKKLLVDIGNRIFARKSIPEALEIIDSQLEKISNFRSKVFDRIQEVQNHAQKLIEEAESEKE